ncbi:DUF488 domain-containing protein [Pseudidiomarina atlantica]|jgi:uncharacterized protein YeaO (DUF488 family)|uniref:DUF488 domain-containing protein n=1 Tax=Pseudidiomarina atlantica TaxID=1517416 RepID=UPI0005569716|nr:DUF488 family protein [Pseudidiomarina atlantica]
MTQSYKIQEKRIYESFAKSDGQRILVDRLWPRGVKKEDAKLSAWCKDITPSDALRKTYHADNIDYPTFVERYCAELEGKEDVLIELMRYCRQGKVTLLTAAKDVEHSHVPIIHQVLIQKLDKEDEQADGNALSSPVCYADVIDEVTQK